MKKHAKIVFKEFGSSFGRFIAITGIIALSVAFLMGLSFVTPDMKMTMTDYFSGSGYYDFTVYPGITDGSSYSEMLAALPKDEDVEKIESEIEGSTVEPVVSVDAYYSVSGDDGSKTVRVVSAGKNDTEGMTEVNELTLVGENSEWRNRRMGNLAGKTSSCR